VINQPQVAILESARWKRAGGGGRCHRHPLHVLSGADFDHRLIDGALADQFTGRVKQILQEWAEEVM